MLWQQWFLVALFALNALCTIWMVEREREPITGPVAMLTVLIDGLLVWLVASIA